MYFSVCEIPNQADTVCLWPAPPRRVFQVTQDGTGLCTCGGHRVRAPSRRCRTPLVHILASPLGRGLSRPRQTLRPVGASSTPPLRTSSPACACRLGPGCLLQPQTSLSGPQGPHPRAAGMLGGGSLLICSPSRLSAGLLPSRSRSVTLTHRTLIFSGQPRSELSDARTSLRTPVSPCPAPHPPASLQRPEPRLMLPCWGQERGCLSGKTSP